MSSTVWWMVKCRSSKLKSSATTPAALPSLARIIRSSVGQSICAMRSRVRPEARASTAASTGAAAAWDSCAWSCPGCGACAGAG